MPKTAFITGITGQDGSFLAELLLSKGYEIHGLIRRSSSFNTERIKHIYQEPWEPGCRLFLHHGDVLDGNRIRELIQQIQPDEVYNLAAQSHVKVSFEAPIYSAEVAAIGALNVLSALQGSNARYYQASSSEMFGSSPPPQNEQTPFHPRSPYACAKVFAYHATVNWRESYGLFACNGILFNHESERRMETFVTRKITKAAARIKLGLQSELFLGNLDAKRDWGYAGDFVEAMWRMLQHDKPDDYVIATGEMHSVQEFVEAAFAYLNLDWEKHVRFDKRLVRPAEVDALCGDASKANQILGWEPTVRFPELVRLMVDADMSKESRLA